MDNLAIPKFPVLFAVVIAFILLMTLGLAYMSGGGYVDLPLAATILIVLIAIARKVIFMPEENNMAQVRDQGVIDDLGPSEPQKDMMKLRSRGKQAIRDEFIVRLMQLNIDIYTMSIYWEDGRNSTRPPVLQNGPCKLIYANAVRVAAEFEDNSLLRYTYDQAIKAVVHEKLDRMVTVISNSFGGARGAALTTGRIR